MLLRLLVVTLWMAASSVLARDLTVFAAASLGDAFKEIGRLYDARGTTTAFQFAGSQLLRTQVENGARPDVLASADREQYAPLERAGLLGAGSAFARNHLILITQRRSGAKVRSLADLARPGVRLVLAAPAVPAGNYARKALAALDASGMYGKGFSARALANIVSEETSVRQVALKVQLGEADAGFVYATDATPALRRAVTVLALPKSARQEVTYLIGNYRGSREGAGFVAFVLSPAGQTVLRRWGFSPP